MSRVSTAHNGITGKRFWNLPAIGLVPAVTQAKASNNTSVTTRSSQQPSQPVARTEGCMVTRFVDLSNECTHFVSAPEHQPEKEQIFDLLANKLRVIPLSALSCLNGFTLEHPSNMAWFSGILHKHHDNWATISISPCLADMIALTRWFSDDNVRRQRYIDYTGSDFGRSHPIWPDTLPLQNEFQLTVLHPNHFHPHAQQSLLVLGTDGHSKHYKASPDGVLKDENGVPLPPFPLPSRDISARLNPILVNFAAALRFRRLKRMDPALMKDFSAETLAVIDASLELCAAVMWNPVLPDRKEGGMDANILALFETLGAEEAMDVLLGGYDFEPLPDLVRAEDGGASPPRSTTSPDDDFEPPPNLRHDGENGGADEERWDVVPAESSQTHTNETLSMRITK